MVFVIKIDSMSASLKYYTFIRADLSLLRSYIEPDKIVLIIDEQFTGIYAAYDSEGEYSILIR
jgi:hypothetical protein